MSDSTSVVAAIDSLVRGVKVSDVRAAVQVVQVAALFYFAVSGIVIVGTMWFIWSVWRRILK